MVPTDTLIAALQRDARRAGPGLAGRLSLAVSLGGLAAFAGMMLTMGPRADLGLAGGQMLFTLKLGLAATLAVAAIALLQAAARPATPLPHAALAVPAALLVFAIGHEVATQPAAMLAPRLIGNNAMLCVVAIPLLSALPLAGLIAALKWAAPEAPGRAGALAGLAAGALGAFFYAFHCADDSPLFVATWYALAIAALMAIGAAAGRRLLAW